MLLKVDSISSFSWCLRNVQLDNKHLYSGDVVIAPNGDIVMVGRADKVNNDLDNIFLLRVTNAGSVTWMRSYGVPNYNHLGDELAVGSDHFVWAGPMNTNDGPYLYVAKFNLDGDLIASRRWALDFYEHVKGLVVDSSDNILILSDATFLPDGFLVITVIKISPSLEILAKHSFRAEDGEQAFSILALSDGGYLVGGTSLTTSTNDYFNYLVKLEDDLTICGSLIEVEREFDAVGLASDLV